MEENHSIDDVRIFEVPFPSGGSQRMLVCRLVVSKEMTDALVRVARESDEPLADTVKGMLTAHLITLGALTVLPVQQR